MGASPPMPRPRRLLPRGVINGIDVQRTRKAVCLSCLDRSSRRGKLLRPIRRVPSDASLANIEHPTVADIRDQARESKRFVGVQLEPCQSALEWHSIEDV